MKKKIALFTAAVLAAGMLSGCGSSETPWVLKDVPVDKYVTLGEYKGIEVSAAPEEVNEEDVETLLNQIYLGSITAEKGGITGRAVAEGDTVNMNYVGTKDDVAFEGGTAEGALLLIGSGQYIEGFEEGLVGVMPGDTVKLNLTFPEDYQKAELAGADVVFEVTVNCILPEGLQDEVVASFGEADFSTVEQLRQYVREYMEGQANYDFESGKQQLVLDAFLAGCTFEELPKKLMKQYENKIRESLEASATTASMSVDEYANALFKTDLETFISSNSQYAVQQSMAFQAVANAENLNVSDEELDEKLGEYATQGGFASVDEFLKGSPKEDFREYFMSEKVMEFLVSNAAIKG